MENEFDGLTTTKKQSGLESHCHDCLVLSSICSKVNYRFFGPTFQILLSHSILRQQISGEDNVFDSLLFSPTSLGSSYIRKNSLIVFAPFK